MHTGKNDRQRANGKQLEFYCCAGGGFEMAHDEKFGDGVSPRRGVFGEATSVVEWQ
jgi:hypothetical protein